MLEVLCAPCVEINKFYNTDRISQLCFFTAMLFLKTIYKFWKSKENMGYLFIISFNPHPPVSALSHRLSALGLLIFLLLQKFRYIFLIITFVVESILDKAAVLRWS